MCAIHFPIYAFGTKETVYLGIPSIAGSTAARKPNGEADNVTSRAPRVTQAIPLDSQDELKEFNA